jgi:hypothetical protein
VPGYSLIQVIIGGARVNDLSFLNLPIAQTPAIVLMSNEINSLNGYMADFRQIV